MFFYSDTEPKRPFRGGSMPPADACYASHYGNYLFLRLVTQNGTPADKHQARKEIDICERKLAYHRNRPGWTAEGAAQACAKMRREWGVAPDEALP